MVTWSLVQLLQATRDYPRTPDIDAVVIGENMIRVQSARAALIAKGYAVDIYRPVTEGQHVEDSTALMLNRIWMERAVALNRRLRYRASRHQQVGQTKRELPLDNQRVLSP